MNVSPSQVAVHLTCPRKRWFQSHLRLPDRSDHRKRDVGTALHAAAERWLRADDQGRVPGDGPVDPFPPGWDMVQDRDGPPRRLSPADAATVRRLFADGVSSGVLRRLPGREVEVDYEREVFPGVVMRGRIDQRSPSVVEDHKTTGSWRWAMSSRSLAADPKMLCYAAEQPPGPVRLRLNYFCKDPRVLETTRAVEATVPAGDVALFWTDVVVPACREMVGWEERAPTIDLWRTVEGPRVEGACEAYGGCPYAGICSGIGKEAEMGAFDRDKKRPPRAAQEPQQEAVVVPAVAAEAPEPAPPWAVQGCQACRGTGINGKGHPCRACDVVSSRTGGRSSATFRVWHDDQGNLCWAEPDGKVPVEGSKRELPEPKPKPEPEPRARANGQDVGPDARQVFLPERELPKPKPRRRAAEADARPISTLFVGCMPVGQEVVDLNDVLAREGSAQAAACGAPSYYSVDAFRRRDALCAQARAIAESLRGQLVLAVGDSPDLRALRDALRPYARAVVEGIR